MSRTLKIKSERGLTLIEVILAVTISAVILAILLAALRMGHRSQEKAYGREELSQRMRILADRVSWLLRGTYPYVVEVPDGKLLYFSGTDKSVGFVTSSVDTYSEGPEDTAGLKWVELFVDSEGLKIREKVYFGEDVFEKTGGKEYVLDSTVRDIGFEYLDTGEEKDINETGETKEFAEWVSLWDPGGREYLPSAVKVELVLEYRGRDVRMPPVIAAIRAGHSPF